MSQEGHFYKCRSCGEGFVTIYGMSCFKCRMMAAQFKPEHKSSVFMIVCVAIIIISCVALAVAMLSPLIPVGY